MFNTNTHMPNISPRRVQLWCNCKVKSGRMLYRPQRPIDLHTPLHLQLDCPSVRHCGRTSVLFLLLSMPALKSVDSFGFLIENYTGHVFWIFCKISKWAYLASFCVLKTCFPEDFWSQYRRLNSNHYFTEPKYYTHYVRIPRSCLHFFW